MTNFHPGYLEQGQPLGMTYQQVLLTADNQNVDPNYPTPVSMVQIGSDNTTATSRTFTLTSSGQVGYKLLLYFYTGGSTTCELADSGTVKLASAWTPTQYDVLELVSDGTYWNELCRGSSTGLPALTSAHIFVGNGSGVATDVAMSGDVTIDNTGATTVGLVATGTLSQANIQAMNGTPVTLIAAPGAGKLIVVDDIEFLHTYSTTAYTNGGDVAIQYNTSAVAVQAFDVALVTAASTQNFVWKPTAAYSATATAATQTDLSTSANKALEITNATAAFATGNAANIFKYKIRYRTVTLLT